MNHRHCIQTAHAHRESCACPSCFPSSCAITTCMLCRQSVMRERELDGRNDPSSTRRSPSIDKEQGLCWQPQSVSGYAEACRKSLLNHDVEPRLSEEPPAYSQPHGKRNGRHPCPWDPVRHHALYPASHEEYPQGIQAHERHADCCSYGILHEMIGEVMLAHNSQKRRSGGQGVADWMRRSILVEMPLAFWRGDADIALSGR